MIIHLLLVFNNYTIHFFSAVDIYKGLQRRLSFVFYDLFMEYFQEKDKLLLLRTISFEDLMIY